MCVTIVLNWIVLRKELNHYKLYQCQVLRLQVCQQGRRDLRRMDCSVSHRSKNEK